MKKPFKSTKVGKILTSTPFLTFATKIPFGVGSMLSDVLNKTDREPGKISPERLASNLVKIAIYCLLLWMVYNGKISFDDAERAKDFISK